LSGNERRPLALATSRQKRREEECWGRGRGGRGKREKERGRKRETAERKFPTSFRLARRWKMRRKNKRECEGTRGRVEGWTQREKKA